MGIDSVERFLAEQDPARLRPFMMAQTALLQMIATRAPLTTILTRLIEALEDQIDGMLCSVLLLSDDGQRLTLGAAPSLPDAYNRAIDGGAVGPCAGSCGTAVFRREQVIVPDIASDPLWRDWKEPALAAGLRACWSTPIVTPSDGVVGSFAIYYREVTEPTRLHRVAIEVATYLAGIAIERERSEHAREALAQELADESQALRRCLHLRDEFIALASHELRTPLAVLRLKFEALGGPREWTPDVADVVLRQLNRLEHLATDLLEYLNINSGHIPVEPADSDLATLAAEAVAASAPEFTRARRLLKFEARGPIPGRWDKARVEQIIDQLLSNALRYGLHEPVDISVDGDEHMGRIRVRDSGIGIQEELHEAIFDPFERAVSWRNYGGLGLGLWICKRIVEALGGDIGVQSSPGEGSVFTVQLPLHPPVVDIQPTCPM